MSSNMYRNNTRLMTIQRATDVKVEAVSRLKWQAARDTQRLRAMRKVFDLYDGMYAVYFTPQITLLNCCWVDDDTDTDTDSDVADKLRTGKAVAFVETAGVVYPAGDAEEMDIEVSAVIVAYYSGTSAAPAYCDSDSGSEVGTLELDEWEEDFDFSSDDDDILTGSEMESVEDEVDDWDCIDDFPVQRSSCASKREVHSYAEALKDATRGREKGS